MRILLVEDDVLIGDGVSAGLKLCGHAVDWVREGESALRALFDHDYDACILDLGLPGRDGLSVLQSVRERGLRVPMLILTARDSREDKIAGLDCGADDYLTKPFDLDELSARIRALMRRRAGRASPRIEHGPLTLDPATHQVTLNGDPLALSAREFALLHALLEQPGVPLSRAQLEERLYGWNEEVESNTVEVYIHALRRKLGAEWIRNVRGVGYRIPKLP